MKFVFMISARGILDLEIKIEFEDRDPLISSKIA